MDQRQPVPQCDTAAVLGAGVMGTAIAAHLAGAGIRTHLLDIVPPDLKDDEKNHPAARNRFATTAIAKALKAKPAPFFVPDVARLVTPGNLEDHLERLQDCDLVIEAVVERLDIKQQLFRRIAPHIKDSAIVASNTSGLSIAAMHEVLPESLQERFLVMHFFNPVRYMRLLELVAAPRTGPEVMQQAAQLGVMLGKGVVYGKDTANFVANRIGVYGMMQVMQSMSEDGLTIEQVDKILGRPMGRPKSAVFRTGDLVGIDTFIHVANNCYQSLPDDEERDVFKIPDWVAQLAETGRLGAKSGAGFYKKVGKDIQVLDATSGEYRAQEKVRFDSLGAVKGIDDSGKRLAKLVAQDDAAAKFAWKVLARSLCYSARRLGEIADDIVSIDRAMRWGFNWDLGPFEAWDALGVEASVARMQADGLDVPTWVTDMLAAGCSSFYGRANGQATYYDVTSKEMQPVSAIGAGAGAELSLKELHLRAKETDVSAAAGGGDGAKVVVKENLSASLVDLGDGCLCLEVHTKMNTIDADVIAMLHEGVGEAERNFKALVVGNDGEHFGAGANLMMVFMAAQQKDWDQIDRMIVGFQDAVQALRYAKVPVVAAPFQYTFGGACELSMAADRCQAHAESYMGLVEVGVGVIPAGGGCLRMVERWTGDVAGMNEVDLLPLIGQTSLHIATAEVSMGAEDARRMRYLLPTDGISLNRDQLLAHAKSAALGMAGAGYRPPRPPQFRAAGVDAAASIGARVWGMMEGGFATEHDGLIAGKLAHILCGGNVAAGTLVDEQHYLDLEREAFLALCGEAKTQARIQSILMSNKPLRN